MLVTASTISIAYIALKDKKKFPGGNLQLYMAVYVHLYFKVFIYNLGLVKITKESLLKKQL